MLRWWAAGGQKVAKVFGRGKARIVVRSAMKHLPILCQVLPLGAERVFNNPQCTVKKVPHLIFFRADKLRDQLAALWGVGKGGSPHPANALAFGNFSYGGTVRELSGYSGETPLAP